MPTPSAPASAPQPGQVLPHARPRPVHWITTAVALAAVVAGAAVLQPSDATATPRGTPAGSGPAPDPRAAHYPLRCGRSAPQVLDHVSGDLDGDGRPETVAVVRCRTDFGTPPSGIYVLASTASPGVGRPGAGAGGPGKAGGSGGTAARQPAPRIAATFLAPKQGMSVKDLGLDPSTPGTVTATLLGYSSSKVPQCCPDLRRKVNWQWKGGKFVLTALPAAGNV